MSKKLGSFSKAQLEKLVRERTKELNCIYGFATAAAKRLLTVDEYLGTVVELLPSGWQYPEITVARIRLNGKDYKTRRFKPGKWRQHADIHLNGNRVGRIEVHYLEKMPESDEGPFLKEERHLIEELSKRIEETVGRIMMDEELRKANDDLANERQALRETNAALKGLISQMKAEELEIKKCIETNVRENLLPILDAIQMESTINHSKHLKILRISLEKITSPFTHSIGSRYPALTATELQICKMIRNGLRSKDISEIRKISVSTVNRHRENIRKKLGLQKSRKSLPQALQEY